MVDLCRCDCLRYSDFAFAFPARRIAGEIANGESLMFARSQYVLFATLVAVLVVSLFSNSYNPYFLDIAVTCGINITLAVSLNLINGFTGQFSLGHAGFMAIGAYSSGVITTLYGDKLLPLVGEKSWILFPIALCVGGLAAAAAGLAVGIPSLRLKGDYLAIVTLGFGEIIRVVILNIPAVGGATGFTDAIPITNFFWIFAMAILTIAIVRNIARSTFGHALTAIRGDEIAAEAMGINTTRY